MPEGSWHRCRVNSKLDSFLKRNLPQSVYERVRVHEACVVISDSVNKLYMFVVLTDDCIYLTENPPKTVRVAAHFGDIFGVELVNDVPEFLSGRDRESAQHIRVIYKTSRHQKKQNKKTSSKGTVLPFVQATRGNVNISSDQKEAQTLAVKQSRSLSCPASDNENLHVDGKGDKPRPLPRPPSSSQSLASFSDFTPDKLLYSEKNSMGLHASLINELDTDADEKMEAQLHLYVVSESSLLFLHLKNSWNNYIIRSTLMQDPQYCRKLGLAVESTDQMAKLFNQLTSELFQDEISLEKMYSLLVELKMAAQKYFVLKRLFWKVRSMNSDRLRKCGRKTNYTIFCTLILDILALMLQETETEPACLSLLISKSSLLLQVSFITGIVKQVTSMLSLPTPPLSPGQMVLLYQQCYILISCIKHGSSLATFIRTEYREEFRYFIKPDSVEEKFSPLYPITQPAFRLICQLLTLVEQES
uniref:Uncharacterized protein n=1 Tax=Erpetoichthys calabaricus TaxID=27687 RepID=A0A8C4RLL1_ERPCA